MLIADAATSVPLTGEVQHPYEEPLLKVLVVGDAILGYAGDTNYLTEFVAGAPRDFGNLLTAALDSHHRSGGQIDYVALRRDGQGMAVVRDGNIQTCERCYIGSQPAFKILRQHLPEAPPVSMRDELSVVRSAFSELLLSRTDGVAGIGMSCTAGKDGLGYETSMCQTWIPTDDLPYTLHPDEWRTVPFTDKFDGGFTVILTGLGYDGVCVAYPQIGLGFLFAADSPECIVKLRVPQVTYRDLDRYDLADLAKALDASSIQVGLPGGYDVPRMMAAFLREELQTK
jgi:hypothetical protein